MNNRIITVFIQNTFGILKNLKIIFFFIFAKKPAEIYVTNVHIVYGISGINKLNG
jgi:hypothetical protein